MPVKPIPKPPFVLYNTVAYSGGLKPDKYVAVFDMGAGFFCIGYRIATSRVEMRAIRRVRILEGHFTVTEDDPHKFARTMRTLALTKGVSDEAYLTLGQMTPFNREEEIAMVKLAGNKLSRRADPEPEVEEEEVETAPAPKAKAKVSKLTPRKKVAAAPEPEPEEVEDEVEEEEEEEVEEEEEEPEEPPAAKAKAKAKAGAKAVVGKAAKPAPAPVAAKGKAPAPAPAAKAKAGNGGGQRRGIEDGVKITMIEKKNPFRDESFRAECFDLMKTSKTVGAYREGGGASKYLNRWADEGLIRLG